MMNVSCPICEKSMPGAGPTNWPEFPFCSHRCRLVDLGRWLNGEYTVESLGVRDNPEAAGDEEEYITP
jgi:endogenous inhibitor of DNA gyrase (YacG/DUF329 family)